MNYLLFDNPQDKSSLSFISRMMHFGIKEVYSPKGKRLIIGWLKGCLSVLKQSLHNDTIVCWYDFQAVLSYWLSRLTFKRRKIVCVNLLLKDKESMKNKVVAWLYKKALNSKHFVASVTSVEYGNHLKKRLGIDKELFLLHDVFHEDYKVNGSVKVHPNTVFCGGRNGRDWKFMIEVAKVMQIVEFHLVMPKVTYEEFQTELPNNVVAKYNLSIEDFMKEMCSCEIVALPLDTEAPAGLIVLFQAAANMKYIITTDTMTTREYLSDEKGCLLPNDIVAWKKAIEDRLCNTQGNCEASAKLLNFLEKECSEKKFVDGIELMIKKVQ
mgnify:CR=1 FL=1